MTTFPITTVQGIPIDLVADERYKDVVVYLCIAVQQFPTLYPHGIVRCQSIESEQGKILLCKDLDDAVEHAAKKSDPISETSHVALEITFTPLGVAYYGKTLQSYQGNTNLRGWHFHDDEFEGLPLQASDEQGNVLISTIIRMIPARAREVFSFPARAA